MFNTCLQVSVVSNKSGFPVHTCANPYCLYISANLMEKLVKGNRTEFLYFVCLSLWDLHNW